MRNKKIEKYFKKFDGIRLGKLKSGEGHHRYNSFDFCFNYFSSFSKKTDLATDANLETSCLHLGFYLASWGMLRGSSQLLQKSLRFYVPVIKKISSLNHKIWEMDIDKYDNKESRRILIETYQSICKAFPMKTSVTLATKIMLGVFGNTPAYDRYFRLAMKKLTKSASGFSSFNDKSLLAIYSFYDANREVIDTLSSRSKTCTFGSGKSLKSQFIPKAKVVDIIGFQLGQQL